MNLTSLNNQDTQEIQKQKDILDTVSINMQDNGSCVITTIIKILELMEVTAETHRAIFMR
jgi:hypothetical protein